MAVNKRICITVEPRYSDPRYSDVLDVTIKISGPNVKSFPI